MASEDMFSNPRMKSAMEQLMKTDEGKELADKLKVKLRELNEAFKDLKGDDKLKFLTDFKEKFSESIGDLKDTLSMKMGDEVDGEFKMREDDGGSPPPPSHYVAQPNYFLFLIAIVLVVLLFSKIIDHSFSENWVKHQQILIFSCLPFVCRLLRL
jgi:hypothetical protein